MGFKIWCQVSKFDVKLGAALKLGGRVLVFYEGGRILSKFEIRHTRSYVLSLKRPNQNIKNLSHFLRWIHWENSNRSAITNLAKTVDQPASKKVSGEGQGRKVEDSNGIRIIKLAQHNLTETNGYVIFFSGGYKYFLPFSLEKESTDVSIRVEKKAVPKFEYYWTFLNFEYLKKD